MPCFKWIGEIMDRYESKLKLDEMRRLLNENKVDDAVAIADSVNWKKVKGVAALCLAGEVYEKAERFEESKELLLEAYERSPIGRTIIYRLALVAVKSGNIDEAEDYYREFVEVAPTDNMRYILKYQILRAKGSSVGEMIAVLEEYKEREGSERWSFELASLYHKAGMTAKCIDLCDEIILWYGDGKYVEKALELKIIYQPLTTEQEKTYRKIKQAKSGGVLVEPDEFLHSGEILSESRVIPEVTTSNAPFNTVNLQQELAENMKKIMEATEKESVSDHMEKIRELVDTIPYLKMPEEEDSQKADEKYGHIETDEEIDGSLMINFQEMLAEDEEGQMSFGVPGEDPMVERQITGQMSIEEVLAEWEKTKEAAKKSLEIAEQRKLESVRKKALIEAENIMARLNAVIPKLDAGMTNAEIMAEEYDRKMEEDLVNGIEVDLEPDTDSLPSIDDYIAPEAEEELVENESEEELDEIPEELTAALAAELASAMESGELDGEVSDNAEAIESAEDIIMHEEFDDEVSSVEESIEDEEEVSEETDEIPEDIDLTATAPIPGILERYEEIKAEADQPEEVEAEEEEAEEKRRITFLTPEQKEIFTYFNKVTGLEKQICQVMDGMLHKADPGSTATGNLLIEGGKGSGKTALATNIIKALQLENPKPGQKVGKITGAALNSKSPVNLVRKVHGGYLMIEKAGDMTQETAESLSLALEGDTGGLTVIMEDSKAGLNEVLKKSASLAARFTERIAIPVFTNDELVAFARSYTEENGFSIDEIAVLALYNRISNIQKVDRATYINEVKEILDSAMDRARRGGITRAFKKHKDEDGRIIIHEKDFDK